MKMKEPTILFLKSKSLRTGQYLVMISVLIYSCSHLVPQGPDEELLMNAPLPGLSNSQALLFQEGAEEFDEVYTQETGLGPIYVSNSCASCHKDDNRGHPFTMLVRFGQHDTSGNQFLHFGGPQLQHQFIPGFHGEILPSGAPHTSLIAPIVSGTGFLELVPDEDILKMADPDDTDGDGISGRAHWNEVPVWVQLSPQAQSVNGRYLCRFGRKASTYNLHQQVTQAFNQDMGITTTFLPQNPFNPADGTNPVPNFSADISDQSLNATVFYIQTLQMPVQRSVQNSDVIQGKEIFNLIGCQKCHTEKLKTGISAISALSEKEFYPYTDLLLHDMGTALDDGYTEGYALSSEWRTAPLWGLGLAGTAQGGKLFLMHDGRATSIEMAIQLHGGEAQKSQKAFDQLSASDKNKLIRFLQSL